MHDRLGFVISHNLFIESNLFVTKLQIQYSTISPKPQGLSAYSSWWSPWDFSRTKIGLLSPRRNECLIFQKHISFSVLATYMGGDNKADLWPLHSLPCSCLSSLTDCMGGFIELPMKCQYEETPGNKFLTPVKNWEEKELLYIPVGVINWCTHWENPMDFF